MRASNLIAIFIALLLGCAADAPPADPSNPIDTIDPGTPVDAPATELPADLRDRIAAAHELDAEALLARATVPHETITFDPTTADHLDLVQGSSLALDDAEMGRLADSGFVVTDDRFPSFAYALETIYMHDLPIYVTADAILEAVHRSYDDILEAVEMAYIVPRLRALLEGMHDRIDSIPDAEVRADADLYLAVARSLLGLDFVAPRAGGSATDARAYYDAAMAHTGARNVPLFGAPRAVDFSQFEPRGHYTEELQSYFRAMTWLGRIDFRLLETQPSGAVVFHRRQLEGAVALRQLMSDAELARWNEIDGLLRAFVGEPDGMSPTGVDTLFAALEAPVEGGIAGFDDQTLVDAIYANDLGRQQILSHILIRDPGAVGPLPLHRSLFFFPQRYVADSHVLSNVVWDRVEQQRMMPDPLDVAYAALGNDQAAGLLEQELTRYGYAGDLEAVRVIVEEHGDAYWQANLYNRWLGALRALSPSEDGFADGLPTTMRTEAWGRRLLGTQLASWAELRHDTILYAKQSYTTGAGCSFPDAYVDPYPQLWAALAGFAGQAREVVEPLEAGLGGSHLSTYLEGLESVALQLQDMAERELRGEPFTAAQLDWINQAIHVEPLGCDGSVMATGWYGQLHFRLDSSADFDPVVADVHTQPTDEAGAPVGRVLHVGTGEPRAMVVTVETCDGPRAYVGAVSTFHQRVEEDFSRLTDDEWAAVVQARGVQAPTWLSDLVTE